MASPQPSRHPFIGALGAVFLIALLTSTLGTPSDPGEVTFQTIQREHFDAIAVQPWQAEPNPAPLTVRVQLVADNAPEILAMANDWLATNANVRLELAPSGGAPLYLTHSDLSATSGRATLGATLRSGMAVEIDDPDLAPCVLTHEILHFLGLRHVEDPQDIMSPHCTRNKLDDATLSASQRDALDRLDTIRALTPRGAETWAARGAP